MTLTEKIEALREAIVGLSNGRAGNCWCVMAVGNPQLRQHTVACIRAGVALRVTAPDQARLFDD